MAWSKHGTTVIPAAPQSGTANTSLALAALAVSLLDTPVAGIFIRASATNATGVSVHDPTNGAGKDSLGNTWVQITDINGNKAGIGTTVRAEVWQCVSVTNAGSAVITFTWTNGGAASGSATAYAGGQLLVDAVSTATGSLAAMTTGALSTRYPAELLLVFEGQTAAVAFTAPAFNPAGTTISVPDTDSTATGTDNNHSHFSSTVTGAPAAQAFTDSGGTTTWNTILIGLAGAGSGDAWGAVPI